MNASLPGEDLIEVSVRDLRAGYETTTALPVAIGSPRLRRLGLTFPEKDQNPEHHLYELLARDDQDSAHSRYNTLIRRLVSYERAAERVAGMTLRDKLEDFVLP